MKSFPIKKIIILFLATGALYFSSCKKDDSSPQTSSDDRDKYLGTWTCDETIQGGPSATYTIVVSKDVTSSTKIKAERFYNLASGAFTFIVVDGNNMTIQSQQVSGYTLLGSGTFNNSSSMTFNFTSNDGIQVDTVHINAHK